MNIDERINFIEDKYLIYRLSESIKKTTDIDKDLFAR